MILKDKIINNKRRMMRMFKGQKIKFRKRSKMMIKKFLMIKIMELQNLFGMKKIKKAKNLWVYLLNYALRRKIKIIKMAIILINSK